MGQTFGGTRPVLSSQWGNQEAGGGETKDDSRENAGAACEEDPLRMNRKIVCRNRADVSEFCQSVRTWTKLLQGWTVSWLSCRRASTARGRVWSWWEKTGWRPRSSWGTSLRYIQSSSDWRAQSVIFCPPFWNQLLSWQLLNKQMMETRAQVATLNYQKKLYRVGEATWLFISVILWGEVDEDPSHLLLLFQEAQERQEQWEEDAKQMLQEKERELNTIGCRKTLNFDKLSELSRAVSLDAVADDAKRKRWC